VSDENKPDALDDGDDLLSDFNDLFPEESDDESSELEIDDETDNLDALLEDLESPVVSGEPISGDEDEIDSLLDSIDETLGDVGADEESSESADEVQVDDIATDDESDLDSLLDGLEEHVDEITDSDEGNNIDSLLDEMVAETESSDERELEIKKDELDLSVAAEIDQSVTEMPEEITEEAVESSLDDLISDEEDTFAEDEPEIDTVTKTAVVTAAAMTTATEEEPETAEESAQASRPQQIQSEGEGFSSRLGGIVVYSLLFIALAVSGGAIWMVLQAQKSADINRVNISQLKKQSERSRASSDTGYNPLVAQNSSAIRDMDQRINELSTVVEGPLSHINSSSEEMMAEYKVHIQQLEQQITDLKNEMGEQIAILKRELEKRPTVVAATTSPPLVVKVPQSSLKPAKLWSLNLLSLSSREGALDTVERLQNAGVNASRNRFIAKDGKTWYRVRVTGFSSYEAAKAYAEKMPKIQGISQTWVTTE